MSPFYTFSQRSMLFRLLSLALIVAILSGCQGVTITPDQNVSPVPPTEAPPPEPQMAEVTFNARVPAELAEGQHLLIEFLDEVTGLALNPLQAQMQSEDGLNFTVKAPFPVGSVLKYRYLRDNDPIGTEYTSQGQQVRYRMYSVDGPGVVSDTIAAWKSQPVEGGLGRIQGHVANSANNAPVVNALVVACGMQTITSSDGSFLLEGLPTGTHNLVVYSLDGTFRTFQQGATVAPDSTTPARVSLEPTELVNVTFIARPPSGTVEGVPVRLIGNIYPLGNTFADLRGGTSVIASRAPLMSMEEDGSYSITMRLPVGLDLRYKYTLGDGFWNAEHDSSGGVRVRQLIVPERDITLQDKIDTWRSSNMAPVSFTVKVPDNTLVADTVSIQFNPFGWTEPIPMWPMGDNTWNYVLYSPLNVFSSASYRYCRNDQCGYADAADTRGPSTQGISFNPQETEQEYTDTISSWAWFEADSEPPIVSSVEIGARDPGFQAGAEWVPSYHPSWQPYLVWAFQHLKDLGSNTVMIAPTWRMTRKVPPVMEPVPGKDPLWFDLTSMSVQAQQKGLNIAFHPVLAYNENPQEWWQSAARDEGWWQSWFDRYETFLLYHADLAAQTGAKTLVLGDENIGPALPGGLLADGSPSGVPGDADARWRKLIAAVRGRYTGKLAWMVPYSGQPVEAPDFTSEMDLLYVRVTAPLIDTDQPNQPDLEASIAAALDSDILSLQDKTNHPIILSLQYPSVRGAFDGCVDSDGTCLPASAFQQPAAEYPSAELGLNEQAAAYSAVLSAVNQRSWIAGFYASGYHPAVELKDMSNSVRNKPASDVLWYWFPRLLGQETP